MRILGMPVITLGSIASSLLLVSITYATSAADLDEYRRLAQDTIQQAQTAKVHDIDQLIAQQAKLVQIGVDACNEYASKYPQSKQILSLITTNANSMKQLTLSEIEEKWHKGGELKKHGYIVKDDHFGQVGNLIDAVIHPATTYIALNQYKTDGNKVHLEQVVAELSEVLVHLEYLDK